MSDRLNEAIDQAEATISAGEASIKEVIEEWSL
jgi:hypothetical protein